MLCQNHTDAEVSNALSKDSYVLDFDGVLVHRFSQTIDFLSARKGLAKVMIESGFNVEVIKNYIDPYDLIKLCYGDWGIHSEFELISNTLKRYEIHAIPKVFIDLNAGELLRTLIKKGKKVYISSLQSTSVIYFFLRKLGVPLDNIYVCGRDSGGRPKPYPDQLKDLIAKESVVIGDSPTDGYLARNINSYFIGLDTDGYTYYELCHVGAIAVFSSLEELLTYILNT